MWFHHFTGICKLAGTWDIDGSAFMVLLERADIWEYINLADVPVSYYVGLALLMVWKFIYLMIAIFCNYRVQEHHEEGKYMDRHSGVLRIAIRAWLA